MRIPDSYLSEVRKRVSTLDLIGQFTELNRSGSNWVGLCPFPEHIDTSPSFTVHPDRGYYCFGCKAGGSVFTFLEKIHGVSWPEAVKLAAESAGMDFPYSTDADNSRDALLSLLKISGQHYFKQLLQLPDKLQYYTENRKITIETVKKYGLGYCDNTFVPTAEANWDREILEESGMFYHSDLSLKEIMSGRWTFPITNLSGKIVAMGGKSVDHPPPYRNTSESVIYNKSSILYGLFQAKDHIRSMKWAMVVEGYFDVLQAAQNGFPNTVGICGTSFTDYQGKLLKRLTDTVVILTDGDSAGQNAVSTIFANLFSAGIDFIKVGFCPKGLDPDDMFKSDPGAGVLCVTGSRLYLDWAIPKNMPPEHQERCLLAMKNLSAKVRDPKRRELLIHFISRRLNVPEHLLHVPVKDSDTISKRLAVVGTKAELMVLGALLNEKPTENQIPSLNLVQWTDPEISTMVKHIISLHDSGLTEDIKLAIYDHLNPVQAQLASDVVLMSDTKVMLMPALVLCRNEQRQRGIVGLQSKIREREKSGHNCSELMSQIQELRGAR